MILLNGTKIVPVDGSIAPITDITGEVFADDESDFIDISGLSVAPRINYAPPAAEIIIKLAQSQQIEHASFNGQVTINVATGTAGTAFPIGTLSSPVNNLADAITIATTRGFDKLYILGTLTLYSGDNVSYLRLVGDGASINAPRSVLIMEAGCITSNTYITDMAVQGVQGGECVYERCVVQALTDTHCQFRECLMVGPVVMYFSAGGWLDNHSTELFNCHAGVTQYVVDYNNSPQDQVYTNFFGRIKVINFTDALANLTIQLGAGEVELDASCTAGIIRIRGVGTLIDNSNGTVVDHSGVVSASSVWTSPEATAALAPEALLGTTLHTRLGNVATVETTGDQIAAAAP
jgi:hypothetical protein